MDRFKQALDYSVNQAKYFPFIHEIWLYGSYARNENTPQSDVDLLVVTDRHLDGKDKIKIKNALCPDDYHFPEVDIHFSVSENEFKSQAEHLFLSNVQKDGKLVYQIDKNDLFSNL